MNATDWVQVAVLGPLLAVVVTAVVLWILSSLGLLDHHGWVPRERRDRARGRLSYDFTPAELAAMRARQRRTERWFDLHDARLVPAPTPTYRPVALRDLVARANRVPGWLAHGGYPPAHLPVFPDPRRRES